MFAARHGDEARAQLLGCGVQDHQRLGHLQSGGEVDCGPGKVGYRITSLVLGHLGGR